MAHDFRNILAVINAGARLILRHTAEPVTTERAEAIGEAVQRGNRMVNQLLSFARGNGAEVGTVDLTKCLTDFEDLLSRSLGEGIEFTWHVDDDAKFVRANSDQLDLALLNLAVNARDAMDGNGRFEIRVEPARDMIAIRASDTGPGVPDPMRQQIFEPFYSTKGGDKGTGLGLAQVAGTAWQASGRAEVVNNPDGGACFTIYLPREKAPSADD